MTPFKNNLEARDRVQHADTGRVGSVEFTPVSTSPKVGIKWQGTVSVQYVHVSKLRLIVDGLAEKVPPCEGEPPLAEVRVDTQRILPASDVDPSEILREKRERNQKEMDGLNRRFAFLKAENDRIDVALKALTPV